MKVCRLLLQAFGPFTDKQLDFEIGDAHLHLIFGPNEAGKSAALRAMTDLRFGIPVRSTDNFVHQNNELRIAGIFTSSAGEAIGLIRRKGKGETLMRFPATSLVFADLLPVAEELKRELTGGVGRDDFERMFAIDHRRLRAGGKQLLEEEGELGTTLFEASAGTRDIRALLASLDEDAKQIYSSHGRNERSVINRAKRMLEVERANLRAALIKPTDWHQRYQAHEDAKRSLQDITEQINNKQRYLNDLIELRTVAPLLYRYDQTVQEYQSYSHLADLRPLAREQRLSAEQDLTRAQDQIKNETAFIERNERQRQDLRIETTLLEHALAIERLSAAIEPTEQARREVEQQSLAIKHLQKTLVDKASKLTPHQDLAAILQALPSETDRASLNSDLDSYIDSRRTCTQNRERLQDLEVSLQTLQTEPIAMPEPAVWKNLRYALAQARRLGDVASRVAEKAQELDKSQARLQQALHDLGLQSLTALRSATPVLEAEIATKQQQLDYLGITIRELTATAQSQERELDQTQLQQQTLTATGEAVTLASLASTRKQRDRLWQRVREKYIDRTNSSQSLDEDFDHVQDLPDAYSASVNEADRQADSLRMDAQRAAQIEQIELRIKQLRQSHETIDAQRQLKIEQERECSGAWSQLLVANQLPALAPASLKEWQRQRQSVLDLADSLGRTQTEHRALEQEALRVTSALAEALHSVLPESSAFTSGEGHSALSVLIDQAEAWEREMTQREADKLNRARAIAEKQTEIEKLKRSLTNEANALADLSSKISAHCVRMNLPSDTTPQVLRARLHEIQTLQNLATEVDNLQASQARQRCAVHSFQERTQELARLLNDPSPSIAADYVDRLHTRLRNAQEQERLRVTLTRDIDNAKERRDQAEGLCKTALQSLNQLCTQAGLATPSELPDYEERAYRKQGLFEQCEQLKRQIAEATSHTEIELRTRLQTSDLVAIDAEKERVERELETLKQEQTAAREREEQTRLQLKAIDSSDQAARAKEAMESAAAEWRTAVVPWARLRLAQSLLQEALNRFRDRAQAPMLASASHYFKRMTGNRFERLTVDDHETKTVIRALRADGVYLGVDAMSEGTADQLYLALRLAALDLREDRLNPMPLILDDVLMTSDDERAANILAALVQFSRHRQVLLFSHHRHLLELARMTLAPGSYLAHELSSRASNPSPVDTCRGYVADPPKVATVAGESLTEKITTR